MIRLRDIYFGINTLRIKRSKIAFNKLKKDTIQILEEPRFKALYDKEYRHSFTRYYYKDDKDKYPIMRIGNTMNSLIFYIRNSRDPHKFKIKGFAVKTFVPPEAP